MSAALERTRATAPRCPVDGRGRHDVRPGRSRHGRGRTTPSCRVDTYHPEVVGDIGGFGGLFSIGGQGHGRPAAAGERHRCGVGIMKLVVMKAGKHGHGGHRFACARERDLNTRRFLFFPPCVAIGKLKAENVAEIGGHRRGPGRLAGCALIGGDGRHPGVDAPGRLHLSGFCVRGRGRPREDARPRACVRARATCWWPWPLERPALQRLLAGARQRRARRQDVWRAGTEARSDGASSEDAAHAHARSRCAPCWPARRCARSPVITGGI